jgi:hypothetical protein
MKQTKTRQRLFRLNGSALLALVLTTACAGTAWAQGDIPSGTITSSGSGPFSYQLTISDSATATSSIGSVWYSWIPDEFFLPGVPTSASTPTGSGWSALVDANSIQFVSSSSGDNIQPGQSLTFTFQASFSPATLAGTANSELSDAYVGAIESDPGKIFIVKAVPEPSSMALFSLGALGLATFGRRKLGLRS